jgi:YD repeat-containing protein
MPSLVLFVRPHLSVSLNHWNRTTYAYDKLRQLTGATNPDGSESDYVLDPVGNSESLTRGGTTTSYAYDGADRLTSASVSGLPSSRGGRPLVA